MIVERLARRRVSTRSFSRESVNPRNILYAISAAKEAPSGVNSQPWRFVIVSDPGLKRRIREVCEAAEKEFHETAPEGLKKFLRERGITWRKPFLENAPYLILVFGKKTEPYWVQSVWLSIGYLLLALEEAGLASLTYTPPKVGWANQLPSVPQEFVLQAIIPVGKSGERKSKEPRLSLNEVAYCDAWGKGILECLNE